MKIMPLDNIIKPYENDFLENTVFSNEDNFYRLEKIGKKGTRALRRAFSKKPKETEQAPMIDSSSQMWGISVRLSCGEFGEVMSDQFPSIPTPNVLLMGDKTLEFDSEIIGVVVRRVRDE